MNVSISSLIHTRLSDTFSDVFILSIILPHLYIAYIAVFQSNLNKSKINLVTDFKVNISKPTSNSYIQDLIMKVVTPVDMER